MVQHDPVVGHTSKGVEHLRGKVIRSVSLEDNERRDLRMEFEEGLQEFVPTAGLCGQSWIERMTSPAGVAGAVFHHVEDSTPVRVIDDELYVYETRFKTSRGDIVIEYHNQCDAMARCGAPRCGGALEPVRWVPRQETGELIWLNLEET